MRQATLVKECLNEVRALAKSKGETLPWLEYLPIGIRESKRMAPFLKRWAQRSITFLLPGGSVVAGKKKGRPGIADQKLPRLGLQEGCYAASATAFWEGSADPVCAL
jgi:hypothetical protein